MSIQNCFADFLEESPVDVAQLTTFSEHIPDEWIAKAVTLSDKATIRRRRLPALFPKSRQHTMLPLLFTY